MKIEGIGKKARNQLALLLRSSQGPINVEDAAAALAMSREATSKFLSYLAKKGWMKRIARGVYSPIPLDALSSEIGIEYPWVACGKLFSPSYVGGWTAANHWDLTEQIFNTIVIFTTQKIRQRHLEISDLKILAKTIKKKRMFGLRTIWQGQSKVQMSDPTRTIVDLLNSPKMGGGLTLSLEIIEAYFRSEHKNDDLLLDYIGRFENGAIYKRLGFILETVLKSTCIKLIEACFDNQSSGYSYLDTATDENRLVSKWNLWVPRIQFPKDKK